MDARIGALALKLADTKLEKGKVIAAEISRFGTAMSPPEANVLKTIGDPDDPEVQAQSVMFRYDLSADFPPDAEREAMNCPHEIGTEEIAAREDLRTLPIVTID